MEDREYRVEIEEMINNDDEERRCNRKMLISLWDSDGVDGHFVRVFGQSRVPGTVFIESLFHLKNYKKSNVSRCHQMLGSGQSLRSLIFGPHNGFIQDP